MASNIDSMFNEIGDGRIVKMEVDCSAKVDQCIPAAEKLSKSDLTKALDMLYAVEKESRLAADMRSNARIQLCIVDLCYQLGKYDALFENIVVLTKKRSLIKQAVSQMIQKCCSYVDQLQDRELKQKLIEVIRTVTEGKIETFGSMDKHEKVEILLEQMRLCLARKDFVRAQIISRKISIKYFDDKSNKVENMKLRFYQQMITLDQNESNYLAICRHFLAIAGTDVIAQNPVKLNETYRNIVLYVILAPHSNEQNDLLHRIKQMKPLEKLDKYNDLLNMFIDQELISWKYHVVKKYEDLLCKGTKDCPSTGVFSPDTEVGKKQWENFQTRVGEHKTEDFLCQLIVDGTVHDAKIDRRSGNVTFTPTKTSVEVMDEWSYNVHHVMDKMNKACHLMAKEEMVHKHLHETVKGV